MNKTICLILVLIATSTFPCYSSKEDDGFRPGYIITRARDSIAGFILIRNHAYNTANCDFKTSLDAPVKTYKPEDVRAYGSGREKYFIANDFEIDGLPKNIFLECVMFGKKSLFFYQDHYFIKTPQRIQELIIQTKTTLREGKNYNVKIAVYKGVLQQELADCDSINEILQNTQLNQKDLKELFTKYYECTGSPVIFFDNEKDKIVTNFGLSVGVSPSQLYLSSSSPADYYFDKMDHTSNSNFLASFQVTFSSSKLNWQLRTGLLYNSGNFRNYYEYTAGGIAYENKVTFIRIEVPLHLKYHFLRKNKAPYFVFGAGVGKMLKWESILSVSSLSNPSFFTQASHNSNHVVVNYVGGLGYDFKVGKFKSFIETSYSIMPAVYEPKTNVPGGQINSLNITTGISF